MNELRLYVSPRDSGDGSVVRMSFGSYGDPAAGAGSIPEPFLFGADGYAGFEERSVGEFLAAAHRIVPSLIAEIYRLRNQVAELPAA